MERARPPVEPRSRNAAIGPPFRNRDIRRSLWSRFIDGV